MLGRWDYSSECNLSFADVRFVMRYGVPQQIEGEPLSSKASHTSYDCLLVKLLGLRRQSVFRVLKYSVQEFI